MTRCAGATVPPGTVAVHAWTSAPLRTAAAVRPRHWACALRVWMTTT